MKLLQIMTAGADVLGWFLLGACLAHQPPGDQEVAVALPVDLCELVPEAIRQEVVAAHSAGLDRLAEYDLRLLAAQATDCK